MGNQTVRKPVGPLAASIRELSKAVIKQDYETDVLWKAKSTLRAGQFARPFSPGVRSTPTDVFLRFTIPERVDAIKPFAEGRTVSGVAPSGTNN